MSEVVDGTAAEGMEEAVATVADAVQRGEVVVIPTDTVYGVGCDAFDAEAVQDLLDTKGRGRAMPPPVLVPNKRTLDGLATGVPRYVRRLVNEFWPGPLTIVLRAQTSLMWDLGDTNGTVAVRMPDSELALSVLAITGPMAVTSANRHGRPAATTVDEAQRELGDAVSVYLDGGPSTSGQASTIIDCSGSEMIVLREGALDERTLRRVAFALDEDDQPAYVPPSDTDGDTDGSTASSPGATTDSETDAGPDSEVVPVIVNDSATDTEPTETTGPTEPTEPTEPQPVANDVVEEPREPGDAAEERPLPRE